MAHALVNTLYDETTIAQARVGETVYGADEFRSIFIGDDVH